MLFDINIIQRKDAKSQSFSNGLSFFMCKASLRFERGKAHKPHERRLAPRFELCKVRKGLALRITNVFQRGTALRSLPKSKPAQRFDWLRVRKQQGFLQYCLCDFAALR